MANAINVKGKSLITSGILNVGDMTIEIDGFENPVSIQILLKKEGLDGQLVKVTFVEPDRPIVESELEE